MQTMHFMKMLLTLILPITTYIPTLFFHITLFIAFYGYNILLSDQFMDILVIPIFSYHNEYPFIFTLCMCTWMLFWVH